MAVKSKKILVFITSYFPSVGGAEVAVHEIARRLPDYQFDLITSRPSGSLKREDEIGSVRVFRVGGPLSLKKIFLPKALFPIFAFGKAWRLSRRNGGYDLILAVQASQAAGAAWLYKFWRKKTPLVVNIQEGKDLTAQGMLKRMSQSLIVSTADRLTAISQYLNRAVARGRGDVIPNGVDLERFDKEYSYGELTELAESLGILPGEKVIVSVSRLTPKNGIDILLKAFALLKQENLRLLLVGDGEDRAELEDLAWKLDIHSRVIFAGSVPHDRIPPYLKLAVMFVRPARSEGLGISFIEAMAARVPVIGTRVGGIPEVIEHDVSGLLCPSEDPPALAAAMDRLLADEKLRTRLADKGHAVVRERFQWADIAEAYRRLFSSLIP